MSQLKIGDRVCIRGLVHSDCLGLTGIILEVGKSALFGPKVLRCKVDFNGKIRHILSVHLRPVGNQETTTSAVA